MGGGGKIKVPSKTPIMFFLVTAPRRAVLRQIIIQQLNCQNLVSLKIIMYLSRLFNSMYPTKICVSNLIIVCIDHSKPLTAMGFEWGYSVE